MKRRSFITLLGGAAAAWPRVAHAQQPAMPVIGFLNSAQPAELANRVAAFRQGLKELGYIEGQNVAMEYRWANGQYERLPELAADLVRRQVAVIAATGGITSAQAARSATTTIPIVFTTGNDPVQSGLVSSLNRPGGNVTGVTLISSELVAKRIELLGELIRSAKLMTVIMNANNPGNETEVREAQNAAHILGYQISVLRISTERDFESAFAALVEQRADALLVTTDPFFESKRERLVTLADRHRIPAMYALREYAVSGGLISYGASVVDLYRQAGVYAGRILKGEKPADLPVQQPTKFELIINLKTAKSLGLEVPSVVEPRRELLLAVRSFVRAACTCPGVLRIALIGSLVTSKAIPKDADVLVTINGTMDLGKLARAGRRLKGSAQTINLGADIFLADVTGRYLGRICHYRECHPRVACLAQHCGRREHLNDDLHVVTLSKELLAGPPVDLWPNVIRRLTMPADVEALLLTELERVQ